MSSRAVHEAAATLNLSLVDRLAEPGWRVTVIYYAAVQKVEACLAEHREHPKRHEDRFNAACSINARVAVPWRKLKQLSEDWRYGGMEPTAEECDLALRWAADMAAAMGEDWPAG